MKKRGQPRKAIKKDIAISIRLEGEQAERVRKIAESKGLTLSGFIRMLTLDYISALDTTNKK